MCINRLAPHHMPTQHKTTLRTLRRKVNRNTLIQIHRPPTTTRQPARRNITHRHRNQTMPIRLRRMLTTNSRHITLHRSPRMTTTIKPIYNRLNLFLTLTLRTTPRLSVQCQLQHRYRLATLLSRRANQPYVPAPNSSAHQTPRFTSPAQSLHKNAQQPQ